MDTLSTILSFSNVFFVGTYLYGIFKKKSFLKNFLMAYSQLAIAIVQLLLLIITRRNIHLLFMFHIGMFAIEIHRQKVHKEAEQKLSESYDFTMDNPFKSKDKENYGELIALIFQNIPINHPKLKGMKYIGTMDLINEWTTGIEFFSHQIKIITMFNERSDKLYIGVDMEDERLKENIMPTIKKIFHSIENDGEGAPILFSDEMLFEVGEELFKARRDWLMIQL